MEPVFYHMEVKATIHNTFRSAAIVLMFWAFSMGTASGQSAQSGVASYYHDSLEGNRTANGEIFDQNRFTAAHKTLPFNTWVKLTDQSGESVVVRVNDRLPARSSRMIDLSTLAARQLDMIQTGLKRVYLQEISSLEAWKWFFENGYLALFKADLAFQFVNF